MRAPIVTLTAVLGAGLAMMLACSTYGSEDPSTPSVLDAGADGDSGSAIASDGAADATLSDGRAGPSEAQPDGLYLTCPPTSTRSKFANLSPRTIVKAGTAFDFPFGIVTDSKYVFWVSQSVPQSASEGERIEAYNGHAKARIHRALKSGTDTDLATTILVDGESAGTAALALDGAYVYWAAAAGPGAAQLRRVARECVRPCVPEAVMDLAVPSIVALRRGRPGLIFALGASGNVFAIDPEKRQASQISAGAGDLPNFAVTSDRVFIGGAFNAKVLAATESGTTEHASYPPADTTMQGGGPIATDCTSLFVWRTLDSKVWSADATQVSVFAPFSEVQQSTVYDVFADHDDIFVASPNENGIRVIDIATRAEVRKYPGSYFKIWADDTGLYAGDHSQSSGGAIVRFGD